jgi:hypothetical protein
VNIQNGYSTSISAFLFSLRNKDGLEPFKSPVKSDYKTWAIYQHTLCGPSFGYPFGNELYIAYDPRQPDCKAMFGKAFETPSDYVYNAKATKELLGGSEYFSPSEIETFYFRTN